MPRKREFATQIDDPAQVVLKLCFVTGSNC